MIVRVDHTADGTPRAVWVWCPACDEVARLPLGPDGWAWDGDTERPTITPSILFNGDQSHPTAPRCHSYLTAGVWTYLDDSTHDTRTAPVVPLPEWLAREHP